MSTGLKSWTSSILNQFRLLTCELPALEGLIDLGKCCPDDSDFIFDQIFIRLIDNEDSHKILDKFDFGADRTKHLRVTCPLVFHRLTMGKCCPADRDFISYWIFIKLPDNEDIHKISDKFNFGPVSNIDVSYPPLEVS